MDKKHKYQIGDLMCLRAQVEACLLEQLVQAIYARRVGFAVLQIQERITQECPGGVQLHYKLDCYSAEQFMNSSTVLEHQLMPLEEAKAMLKQQVAEAKAAMKHS